MKLCLFIIAIFLLASCATNDLDDCVGFQISEHLFSDININGYSYYYIAEKAVCNEDLYFISLLSKVSVSDGATYEHGAILIEAIDHISEEKYLEIFSCLTKNEQTDIMNYYLPAGLDFTENPRYKRTEWVSEAFPILNNYFKSN